MRNPFFFSIRMLPFGIIFKKFYRVFYMILLLNKEIPILSFFQNFLELLRTTILTRGLDDSLR